ncbi:hypothetical protein LWI29_003119 [Acer saccharum]|uniref:C-JID domain-containing protein n=1 Tax=Acer saccharum TaxID=4024 RepID=A0AA39SW47_ACESA|nr:hypothetical protein LWI29_003119 [Acer saccharum]
MNCKHLRSLPNTSEFAEFITSERNSVIDSIELDFMFTNSPKLNEEAFSNVFAESLQIIKQMGKARKKYQKDVRVSICYPGSKIPEWFCYQSHRSSINIQLSPHNCSNCKFLGLALCVVIAFEGYCYTKGLVPYVCRFLTDCGDWVTYKGELTFRADRNYKDSIFINSDHVILGYHEYSHGKLSMDDLASFKVMFKTPEDSSPSCRLKYCGVCPIYAEPEIIQTSISDEKFDSTNQDLVPDPKTITEKKLTLLNNNKVVLFYRISRDKVGLWLFYCWIFLVCLFCGLCVFGMLVFLVLQLSTRCKTYLSSHVQNTRARIRPPYLDRLGRWVSQPRPVSSPGSMGFRTRPRRFEPVNQVGSRRPPPVATRSLVNDQDQASIDQDPRLEAYRSLSTPDLLVSDPRDGG